LGQEAIDIADLLARLQDLYQDFLPH